MEAKTFLSMHWWIAGNSQDKSLVHHTETVQHIHTKIHTMGSLVFSVSFFPQSKDSKLPAL